MSQINPHMVDPLVPVADSRYAPLVSRWTSAISNNDAVWINSTGATVAILNYLVSNVCPFTGGLSPDVEMSVLGIARVTGARPGQVRRALKVLVDERLIERRPIAGFASVISIHRRFAN